MNMNDIDDRLEKAKQRTEEIHLKIGTLSTYFASIELQLFEMLSKFANPVNPEFSEIVISQLSFRQCTNALWQYVKKYCRDENYINNFKTIKKRLDNAATERNEIIHSSWIAYSLGQYGQHRARSKNDEPAGLKSHENNPRESVAKLIDELEEILFELICFEKSLNDNKSIQNT